MRKADNLPPSCAVVTKSDNPNFLEPSGPLQASNGTAYGPPLHQGLDCQAYLLHIPLEFVTGICVSVMHNDYYGNSLTSMGSVHISFKVAPSYVKYFATYSKPF